MPSFQVLATKAWPDGVRLWRWSPASDLIAVVPALANSAADLLLFRLPWQKLWHWSPPTPLAAPSRAGGPAASASATDERIVDLVWRPDGTAWSELATGPQAA